LREFRPDLLHVHVPNTSAFALLGSARARRLPWVVHWHADIPQDSPSLALRLAYPVYRPFETALLRRAAAVIATSPHYRDSSRALAPWREKVSVVPLSLPEPLPPSSAAPMPWPDQPLRLLAVGRLSHYKGFDVLLQALAATPGVGLILVGDGEEEAALRALADRLGLVDRVQFAGHVDDATLHAAYASAHAFCLPSLDRAEAFGMVLLEAMRARLPIVASRIAGSGVNHVLDDRAAGLLVPPADAASLAKALARLRDDAELRRTLADAGNARWRRCFIPARTTPALLDLYRQVLART
jgi:glycosyltransferase involved in cell wall biosynthesis